MDLHELQRLLKPGKEHEAQLKKEERYDKLEVTEDRNEEKSFKAYCRFGKLAQRSLSHNLKKLPEFNVHENEKPTEYVEKCVKRRWKTIEARFQLVKCYLSEYHQEMIRRSINSMMHSLGMKQKSKGQEKLEKYRSGKAKPQSNTNLFETPLLGSASVPSACDAVPINIDSAVTPMLPSPLDEQVLDEAMIFLKEKTTADKAKKGKTTKGKTKKGTKVPVKEYLKMLEQLDSSKSKYKELHQLERCLKLGLKHEQLFETQEHNAELMFKNDLHEQYHYEPYFEVVKKLKTFIAKKNWNLLPEFNVVDPQSKTKQAPELYGSKCKDIMKNLFDQRYAFVKPYLSSYHQTLIERNNTSTLHHLMNKRVLSIATNPLDLNCQPIVSASHGAWSCIQRS